MKRLLVILAALAAAIGLASLAPAAHRNVPNGLKVVRLGAAGQTLTIPVASGSGNGRVVASGRLISDGTSRAVTVLINGATTNVAHQYAAGAGATASAAATAIGTTGESGGMFEMICDTKTGFRRYCLFKVISDRATDEVYVSAAVYADTSTEITSIGITQSAGTGLAAGTYAVYQEISIP